MHWWQFALIAVIILAGGWWGRKLARGWAYDWRHAKHLVTGAEAGGDSGPGVYGSMCLEDEWAYRAGHFPPPGEWNRSSAETDGGWEHRTALYNGHTWGCLIPDVDHVGACPEEGDWDDGRDWPGPEVPYLPAPGPVDQGPSMVDHPEDAGWTDQLLADLREAPTVLDSVGDAVAKIATNESVCECGVPEHLWLYRGGCERPELERMADTGEINLASLRADYAAELRAQDDDAAEFISQKASQAAELRLQLHGLA